jgi:hypothetical protein
MAPSGAGLYADGDLTLTNVTLDDNLGANTTIVAAAGSDVGLFNVTLTAAGGTGIANSGSVAVQNSIIAEGAPNCSGAPVVSAGSNIEDANDCGLAADGDLQNTDPMLGELSDNGGPTLTRALLEGSPAIDSAASNCPAMDQRGQPRPQGNGCDIGASESSGSAVTPSASAAPNLIQGDVNCDGQVDEDDFFLLIEFSAGLFDGETAGSCPDLEADEPMTGFPWADVNCDGVVNVIDSLFVIAFLADVHLPQAIGNCFDLGTTIQ